jgi:predicted anti-sigma-YlaC factor YlaD
MTDGHDHHDEITCREFVEVVTDYLEAALPEDRADLIEEHLVLCVACKRYLDQYEATVGALPAAADDEPVSEDTRTALLAAFRDWKAAR